MPKTARDTAINSTPKTMRAAAIDRFGGPEVLQLVSLPVPQVEAGEVLIALDTAGVGGWDADMRGGWSPSGRRPRFPLVLGIDGSGVVAAVGPRVRRVKVGDPVYAYGWDNPKGGFYAQYVAVPGDQVAIIPDRLDLKGAGALPTTGLTALQGIDDALKIRKGESLLIHGASGGVGTIATQIAKLRGARTLATASGKAGIALARRLGATLAIDGHRDDIEEAALRFAPKGLDAALLLAGGKALPACLRALHAGARVAYPNGIEPAPKTRRSLEVTAYDGVPGVREFERLGRVVEAAKLKVPIAAEYKLADAAKAHARLAAGHILGKVILRIR
jgi:NADPH:quinone reductase-like Zn-dependent oxidoreductase